ncbi:hypothetical protein AGR6A_Cc150010 [Agrobacterium sp. NCPPB 925]|nr:hypothetical protein AGR6A_Cc150010 [Agrobacterium sp. NCPPB 925]
METDSATGSYWLDGLLLVTNGFHINVSDLNPLGTGDFANNRD